MALPHLFCAAALQASSAPAVPFLIVPSAELIDEIVVSAPRPDDQTIRASIVSRNADLAALTAGLFISTEYQESKKPVGPREEAAKLLRVAEDRE